MREMPSRISNGMFIFYAFKSRPEWIYRVFVARRHTAARALVRLTHYNKIIYCRWYYHYYNIYTFIILCVRTYFRQQYYDNNNINIMYDDFPARLQRVIK